MPRRAPKGTVEEGHEKSDCIFEVVASSWHHLGDFGQFWGALEIRGAPKTVQKIEYGDFWGPLGGQKAEQIRFGMRLEKT